MKQFFLILIFSITLIPANAQKVIEFIQAGAGMAIKNDGYMVQAEYGKSWKFLDFSISLNYESSIPPNAQKQAYVTLYEKEHYKISDINNQFSYLSVLSTLLNVKMDIVRLLVGNSKHSVKLGAGAGFFQETHMQSRYFETDDLQYDISNSISHGLTACVSASYEYNITEKMSVGAFVRGSYLFVAGLSLRRNF